MTSIFFSPRSTTKAAARAITGRWTDRTERDLVARPLTEDLVIPAEEPVLVAMPVYAGFIPTVCRDMLTRHLKGSGGPAVAVAVYGNRDYDDALAELQDILEGAGFHVVAAGAFIGRHSIFTDVAAGRPDESDKAVMAAFGEKCAQVIAGFDPDRAKPVTVKGKHVYKKPMGVPFKPDCNQNCIKCMACVKNCPTGAIPKEDPTKTDGDKCISCGSCIYLCPVEARQYRGAAFAAAGKGFALMCAKRKEPETFF